METKKFLETNDDSIPSWNDAKWESAFAEAIRKKDFYRIRSLRQQVFMSTLEIVKVGKYRCSDGGIVLLDLEENIDALTVFYSEEIPAVQYLKPVGCHKTSLVSSTAVNDDCLSFARKISESEDSVCVLNMASRKNPGGGVINGAGAQEEYLFRCSDYFRSLYQYVPYASQYGIRQSNMSYPLDKDFGGIFTPRVTIFRDTEENGYRLLHEPWKTNMIAVAGMNHTDLTFIDGEERIDSCLIPRIKNKMRTIFRIAAANGQKVLILGALGCGAFRNPPKHTAELFKEVTSEPEFADIFRKIFFVIKEDHNSRGAGNFLPFADVFGTA